MSERRIQIFIIIMFGGSPTAQTFTQFLIDSSNMYVAKNSSKQEFNEKWSRSLSHFLQPTAWHSKFNSFSCAISNQYFNNFLGCKYIWGRYRRWRLDIFCSSILPATTKRTLMKKIISSRVWVTMIFLYQGRKCEIHFYVLCSINYQNSLCTNCWIKM